MDGRFNNRPLVNDHQEDTENSPENSGGSPLYGKMASTSFPKRRRGVHKRVVSVPIKGVEGSRSKSDNSPPSDSWSWRKYGQKPIKGSPYPRGYFRCSSSKGCPARKQVERSHVDPTMLLITYSSEHNHHMPPSKKSTATASTVTTAAPTPPETTCLEVSNFDDDKKPEVLENPKPNGPDEMYDQYLGEESLINPCEFKWFSELETTACAIIGMPSLDTTDGRVIVSMREEEEDESLFGGLGELPECSVVFRRVKVERAEEEEAEDRRQLRCNLTTWCGTTM